MVLAPLLQRMIPSLSSLGLAALSSRFWPVHRRLLLLLLAAVMVACGSGTSTDTSGAFSDSTVTSSMAIPTTVADTTTIAAPATLAPDVTTTTPPPTPAAAPWSNPPLAPASIPSVFIEAWEVADNHLWCSALAPTGTGPGTEDAVARRAEFGGGWAVAWDLPTGPGKDASGTPCTDCGRSAFGVAGVGMTWDESTGYRWPSVVEWTDGSVLGYGGEGFDQGSPTTLGEIHLAGQGCMYQVWTHLGPEHLVALVDALRFVDGLEADPVELRLTSTLVEGGPAPWAGESLPSSSVPEDLRARHAQSGLDVPLLAFDAPGLPGARIRSANLGGWGVAWDLPDGPGHDRLNYPCADCGRGAVGLGGRPLASDAPMGVGTLIQWDDGSFAEYGLRLGLRHLPPDRVVYRDQATGEWVPDGWEARIVIPGFDAEYLVWTHLGEEYLLELLNSLRFVEG